MRLVDMDSLEAIAGFDWQTDASTVPMGLSVFDLLDRLFGAN